MPLPLQALDLLRARTPDRCELRPQSRAPSSAASRAVSRDIRPRTPAESSAAPRPAARAQSCSVSLLSDRCTASPSPALEAPSQSPSQIASLARKDLQAQAVRPGGSSLGSLVLPVLGGGHDGARMDAYSGGTLVLWQDWLAGGLQESAAASFPGKLIVPRPCLCNDAMMLVTCFHPCIT